jgi:isoleucyl-tRNA synthetase
MVDYKKTLNLPRTKFPMRANLTKNEPRMLKFWEEINAYQAMIQANQDKQRYVLHDGPPYANGHIHLGTAMNKILKDIIVKSKNMQGYRAEYVPGWDCHGLPIELKVEQTLGGKKKEMHVLEIRQKCREYARKFLDIQRKEFKRLGVLGVWDKPYLTMTPDYEAATARELGRFMARGAVKRAKKPIYWCISCMTALAEAEVEYYDHTSPSIYVRFPLPDPGVKERFPGITGDFFVVIWTTTPWTIPDNMAVALHPDFDYVVVNVNGDGYILAEYLLPENKERFGWESAEVIAKVKGADLEGLKARHPFYDRPSPLVLADYVTLDTGTGCVHTAPGHGREDYETGLKYGLDVLSPLDDEGRFLNSVEFFAGLTVFEANPEVINKLKEVGNLLAQENITHSYPHCWRCKKPVIFRATTQWFISMDENNLRQKALKAIDEDVKWIPAWGRDRIYNMVEHRPDWCISRQRMWGVPIIALLCKNCGEAWHDPDWVQSVVEKFATHERGADYWFEAEVDELKPADLTCPHCGSKDFTKEDDILDVWFDSGTSFAAVLEGREECRFPADLYLEGTDQHRGWFHSSLLASIGTRDVPPYRAVLTHGFVVDGQGRKMSKSIGNVIAPQEIIDKYGAEILRIWVASENYQEDLRISDEILKRLVDAYRRIRNTCRFILGNLTDFDLQRDAVANNDLLPLDRFALHLVYTRHNRMQKAYNDFEFHRVFHTLHNLCVTDLSAFYLDILKDRLYVSGAKSLERRSAQTALYQILLLLLQDMAPILSFTAEEVYQHLPEVLKKEAKTVFALSFRPDFKDLLTEEEKNLWNLVLDLRAEVTRAIEPARKSGLLGHSLDSRITLYVSDELQEMLLPVQDYLREVFIVSGIAFAPLSDAPEDIFVSEEIAGLKIKVEKARGEKCQRCWIYSEELQEKTRICPRCAQVIVENF